MNADQLQPFATSHDQGALAHFRLNFLTLFGRDRTTAEIEQLAATADAQRIAAQRRFAARLGDFKEAIAAAARDADGPFPMPAPVLRHWDRQRLVDLIEQYGSLLLAAFHYGDHRQIIADLTCLDIAYIAPIAEVAQIEQMGALQTAPEPQRSKFRLVDVRSPRVGRELLRALRSGHVGVFFVDGNMGPDGPLAEEGSVVVDFLGQRIRVKSGIARMSTAMQLPILPIMLRTAGADRADSVAFGPLIEPITADANDADVLQQCTMQRLYDTLADCVAAAPQHWDYAYCMHRWIEVTPSEGSKHRGESAPLQRQQIVFVRRDTVAPYRRDGELFWVHLQRQKAYRLPDWALSLHELLSPDDGIRIDTILAQIDGVGEHQLLSLLGELEQKGLLGIRA